MGFWTGLGLGAVLGASVAAIGLVGWSLLVAAGWPAPQSEED